MRRPQEQARIEKVHDLVRHLEENCEEDLVLFRGQPRDKPLLPRIARLKPRDSFRGSARQMLAELKRRSIPLVEIRIDNDWDWLALGRVNTNSETVIS
jgi:hypothetical protein